MNARPNQWTVVSPAADGSPASTSASALMGWLHHRPEVSLHTVLWASGPAGTASYDFGRFTDIGSAHEALLPQLLRGVGLTRLGGGLAGRSVRARLRPVPRSGVLYLSSAAAVPVVRYLPDGDRTVVTHLHRADLSGEPALPADRVATLRAVTDVWLAVDEDTRTGAVQRWGLDPATVHLVPELMDPLPEPLPRPPRVGPARLGLVGEAWFNTDHTARMAQILGRLRPDRPISMTWMQAGASRSALAPMIHDLERLGAADRLTLPPSIDEVRAALADLDVLVLASPDHDLGWVIEEAKARGVPVVCFDTHRAASGVDEEAGLVVSYLDVEALAEAVLTVVEGRWSGGTLAKDRARASRLRHDVSVLGPDIVALAQGERVR